jgi:hypothetical protein
MQYITANLEKLPRQFDPDVIAGRVESGALQINEDWPMTAIRGDHSAYYADVIRRAIIELQNNNIEDVFMVFALQELRSLLMECILNQSQSDNDVGC